jgi:O-antigen/teichoic acid export membrane protein
VGLSLDYLVIGALEGAAAVGLYSLAFVIAFVPVEHFSAEVGKVLFAAAAASNLASSGARTVQAVRVMSAVLLPVLPPAIALAPVLVPAILGDKWEEMVAPLQLLLVVGVGYAILNCIGEALSGCGEIAFRARVNAVWILVTLIAMLGLVALDGIRGAALAHLLVLVPYAAVYLTVGTRRVGTSPRAVWDAVRPVCRLVAVEAIVTAAVALALAAGGVSHDVALSAGALAGLAVLAAVGVHRGRARKGAAALRAALRSEA